jgi:hypothetical protein
VHDLHRTQLLGIRECLRDVQPPCAVILPILPWVSQQPRSSGNRILLIWICAFHLPWTVYQRPKIPMKFITIGWREWPRVASKCAKAANSRMLYCVTVSRHAPGRHIHTNGLEHLDQLCLLAFLPRPFCSAAHLIGGLVVRDWARVYPICLRTVRIRAKM